MSGYNTEWGAAEEQHVRKLGKSKTILRKMMVPMVVVLLLQACMFLGVLLFGGTLRQLNQNAVEILNERVINRKNYLENEMIQYWSGLDESVEYINGVTAGVLAENGGTAGGIAANSQEANAILEQASKNLIELLRRKNVTGVFLVLNGQDDPYQTMGVEKSGIYFRDLDPLSNSVDNTDLMLERAPSALTRKLGITMDTNWNPQFAFPEDRPAGSYDFFYKPFRAALEYAGTAYNDLGYWSRPFRFSEGDIEVITYSVPLLDAQGAPYGVLGVEISVQHLKKLLPYDELAGDKAGSYMLSIQSGEEPVYENLVENGPIFQQIIGSLEEIRFLPTVQYKGGYKMESSDDTSQTIYGCIQYFQLYNTNTPFEQEQWALIGVLESKQLFGFADKVRATILAGTLVSLILGLLSVVVTSRVMTNPITLLVRKVKGSNPNLPVVFEKTWISEIDELADAITSLSGNVAESASRLSKIIESASIAIGAFEYRVREQQVFYTGRFFDIIEIDYDHGENGLVDKETFEKRMLQFKLFSREAESDGTTVFQVQHAQDSPRWVRMKVFQEEKKVFGVVEDITQEVIEKKKLEYERDYDLLTNLLNRRAFYVALEALFAKPEELGVGAMVMFDLDNLKYINDTYGHDYGDRYIRCIAGVLKKFTPGNAVLSRLSGDEFYLFLYGYPDKQRVETALGRLKRGVGNTVFPLPGDPAFRVRASAGVAWYPFDSDSYEKLIHYADFAMYTVKNTVKGEIRQFDAEEYQKDSYLLHNREALNKLIDQNLLEYHFQPIVHAATGKVFAYEALMRSKLETLHSPAEILTLARSQSKLYQIERLTWFDALESYSRLESVESSCRLFINSIANQTLSREDMAEIERQYRPLLNRIVVEITEEEKQNDVFVMLKREYTKKWGAAIALDDFGTGYNGETMLLHLSPQYVKIDMSIVRDIDIDENRQKLLTNLLSYTKERQIEVIAEGVETAGELRTLLRLGVDYLQGFYLGMPSSCVQPVNPKAVEIIRSCKGKTL